MDAEQFRKAAYAAIDESTRVSDTKMNSDLTFASNRLQ